MFPRNGKLSLLNNKIRVFEYDTDENGNTNGRIWATNNKEGIGATITFTLPIKNNH